VVGAKESGKTGFVGTLVGNLRVGKADGGVDEGWGGVEGRRDFGREEGGRGTREMRGVEVEIGEGGERVVLSVMDTPGFDATEVREGNARNKGWERIVEMIERRFDETLTAVSFVNYFGYD
jgi:septin family protein